MSRETSPIFVNSQDLDDDVIEIESSDDDDIVALDTPPPKPRAGKERQNKGKRKMIITVDSDDDDTGGGGGGGGGAAGAGAAVPKTQSLRDVLNIFPDADHVHIHAVRHPLFCSKSLDSVDSCWSAHVDVGICVLTVYHPTQPLIILLGQSCFTQLLNQASTTALHAGTIRDDVTWVVNKMMEGYPKVSVATCMGSLHSSIPPSLPLFFAVSLSVSVSPFLFTEIVISSPFDSRAV